MVLRQNGCGGGGDNCCKGISLKILLLLFLCILDGGVRVGMIVVVIVVVLGL